MTKRAARQQAVRTAHAIIPQETCIRARPAGGVNVAHEIEIRFPSDPRWLRPIRSFIEEFAGQAGLGSQACHEVMLAVGEALTNVMRHSYNGDCNQKVWLKCSSDEGTMEIEIRDRGEAFEVEKTLPAPDELRPGGRGIYLIRSAMDEVEYSREGDQNLVRMRKVCEPRAR